MGSNIIRKAKVILLAHLIIGASLGSAPAAVHPLTVVSSGGATQKAHRLAYWNDFTRETGIALQEATWQGGIGVIRTKIRGGQASWDVVQVEVEELILGCEEGLFEPLDWRMLGGRDSFFPAAVEDCGVGSMIGSYLLGYDGARLAKGPRSWASFWDVKTFPGKRGMRKTAKYTLEIALMADGVPPRDVYNVLSTPSGVDRAFAKLDHLKPYVVWWTSTSQVPDLLASGEVIMSVATPGRLVMANRTENRNFKFVWDGNLYAADFWAILKNSPNKRAAMRLIAYMTQPQHQRRLPAYMPSGVTRKEAARLVDPAVLPYTPSDPRNMRNALAIDADFWVENADQLNQRFFSWAAR